MREALDLYLATAPFPDLLIYVGLAILTVGLGPLVPAFIFRHVVAVRGAR